MFDIKASVQMYQLAENTGLLTSPERIIEEQPSFLQCGSSQVDALSSANFDWHLDNFLILEDLGSSVSESPREEDSPRSREFTPLSPSSTSTTSKEAAHSRRLKQNRKAQRAFRARQRERVECLEQQFKTVVGKYEELQQRYAALSASHDRLVKQKKELGEEKEELCPSWTFGLDHVTDDFWKKYALEGDEILPTSRWQ
ncbi:hypothetical protein N431DRAFT_553296 [Stipitochalara longipes BDJ]|nr:hypothetical protein N431DRAFT_553296 [Stipitochalara longipes BDJ]